MGNMLDTGKAMRNVGSPCTVVRDNYLPRKKGLRWRLSRSGASQSHVFSSTSQKFCNMVITDKARHASKVSDSQLCQ